MQVKIDPAQSPDTFATTTVPVPEASDLALRYYRSSNPLWVADTVLGLLLPAVLLFTGLSARLRTAVSRLAGGRWFFTAAGYGALYVLLTALVVLPLDWYRGFVRQHAYGLSVQTAGQWFGNWTKSTILSCLITAAFLWLPYLLLRRSPRRWWLWTGLATAPLVALFLLVKPVLLDPVFNKFGPMRDRALEARILAMAAQAGIKADRVYEVAKSKDTKQMNAYVTGLGSTRRIVLWDTLVDRLPPDEVLFVMGHEMGHFVLHHIFIYMPLLVLVATISLYAVHRIGGRLIPRFPQRFGFDSLADPASVPLLVLVGTTALLALNPATLAVSRWNEHEADRFALEITRNNRAAALTFVHLQEGNLNVPRTGLFYRLWRGSHPDMADRIDFANRYHPWTEGGTLRYGHLFHPHRSPD